MLAECLSTNDSIRMIIMIIVRIYNNTSYISNISIIIIERQRSAMLAECSQYQYYSTSISITLLAECSQHQYYSISISITLLAKCSQYQYQYQYYTTNTITTIAIASIRKAFVANQITIRSHSKALYYYTIAKATAGPAICDACRMYYYYYYYQQQQQQQQQQYVLIVIVIRCYVQLQYYSTV